jgi:hypothetical protein
MANLSELLNDPDYVNANEATKAAIFTKYAPSDEAYTKANAATQAAIRSRFGVEGQEGMGPRGGLDRGIYSGYQQAKSAFAGLAGRTGLMSLDSAKAVQEEAEDKRSKAFKPSEKGWAEDPFNKFGELLGQSAPFMVAPIVAGGVATIAGAPALVATGLGGLASAAQFTATNLARQQDTGVALEDTNLGSAALASIPQAAFETISFRMMPIVQKIFGAAGKPLTAAEATAITQQGLFKTAGEMAKTGVKVGGTEGLTEVGQQFFERLQAGLNIADKDARDEYLESFVSGAILGAGLSVPGAGMRRMQAEQVVEANKPQTFVEPTTGITMTVSPIPLTDENLELAGTQEANGQPLYIYAPKQETTETQQETTEIAPPAAPPATRVSQPQGAPSNVGVDQAAMEEEWLRSQGQLPLAQPAQITQTGNVQVTPPGEPAPTPPVAPAAQVAQTTPAGNVQPTAEDIVPLDDKGEPKEPEVLDPNVEAQLAAEPFDPDSIILPPKEEPIVAAPKPKKVKASEKILSAHEFIASLGGLDKKEASEINKDAAKSNVRIGNKWLYASKGGLSAAQAAEKLAEAGYIQTEDNNEVYRVISDSLVDPVYSLNDADAIAERQFNERALDEDERYQKRQAGAAIEAQDISAEVAAEQAVEAADLGNFRQQMLDAGYTEQDLNVIGFTKASPELQAEVAALEKQVSEAGLDPSGILESLGRTYGDRLITKQEYYAKAKDELAKAIREKAVQGGGRDVSQVDVPESAESEAKEIVLYHGTKSDVTAKQLDKTEDLGPHFTVDKNTAQIFADDKKTSGRVLKAKATFSKVLSLPDLAGWFPTDIAKEIDKSNGVKEDKEGQTPLQKEVWSKMGLAQQNYLDSAPENLSEGEIRKNVLDVMQSAGYKFLKDYLSSKGYDAIKYTNTFEGKPADTYIALNMSKIKDVSEGDTPTPSALTSPTEKELKDKQEAADKAAADKAKADRDADAKAKADAERKEIAARSEKAAGEFKLGKTAEEDLSGQKDILAIAKKADVPPELQKPTDFVLKEGRIEEVVLAARALAAKKITKAEYDAYVDAYAPIATIPNPEGPLSVDGMKRVLKSNQVGKINPDIKDGTRVGIRMDINALKRARALSEKSGEKVSGSVVSIHEGSDKNTQGDIIGYSAAASIKNARFAIRNEQKAFKVAQGIEDKSPQQTIEGEWVNISPDEAYSRVKSLLKDPSWAQVSLDPLRHSFFYDRSNKQPVVSADEILQVGRFVLAKNVKYAARDEFLYNVGKKNKSKEFKTLDGFTFYLTEDGRVVDNLDPDKVDMSWDSFNDFMEATSNLRTIFPDQEIASSNSAEQIRKENIAKYASLKQKLAAIQRRFTQDKTKEFDKETYKYLYRQANDLKDAIQSTKEPKTSPADFLARAAKELADGNISQEVYDVVDAMYKKNPSLLDGLRLSVKTATGKVAELDLAGQFLPLTKIVRLFKESEGTTNPSTLRHEVTHSLEQLMTQDAQAALVDAWGKSLLKATRNAKTDADKAFFVAVGNFIENPTNDTMLAAVDAMPDYSYYQYINPSEFWAVNAEPLMASYLGGGWQRFKTSVKGLFEALKNTLGFDNKSSVYKTFNSVVSGKRDRTSPMLTDYVGMVSKMLPTYNVTKPTKKPSQATLPGVLPAPKSLPLKPRPDATWQSLEPMTWKDTRAIQLFDKHRNLDLVQKEITKIAGDISNELNAYRAETLAHGRAERQVKDFLTGELRPIIKEMKDNNVTDDGLTEYLVMRHAEEANDLIAERNPNDASKQDKGSGISYKQREDYFKALDPAKNKAFESIAKKVDEVLKKTRDLLEEGGVITKEQRDAWESLFEFYVPLRREESDYSLPSSSYRRVGDYAKSRTGSAKDVIDVLSNVASAREIAIHRIEKEKVNRAVYGLAVMNPNPEFWMAISPDAIKNKDVLIAELEDKFDLSRQDAEAFVKNIMAEPTKERFNKETGVVDRYIDTTAKYADYVLPVKIDGKDRFVFFNPKNDRSMQMVQSLRGLDVPQLNAAMQTIAPVTRFFSAINTQYNLIFGAWNFARDVQGARINLSTTPIADEKNAVLSGTFSAIPDIYTAVREQNADQPFSDTSDGSWDDFTKHGGKVGYKDQFAKLNQSTNIVNRELATLDRGITMRGAYAVLNWVSNVNDVLENATRLSAYRVALDKFKKEAAEAKERKKTDPKVYVEPLDSMKARAADIAKNITVNFNRKGTWGVTAGSLYAFFNASAQGTKRLYETLTGPKGKTIMAAGIGIGIAQAIALAMAGFDEDEPTEFMKQKNLIIPTGDGKYVMWPMPFGFNVFPNLGRIFFETASKASKGQSVTPQLINTVTMLANAFNPLGGGGLLQMATPTVADPIVALIENRDAFGRPISRESRATSPVPGYQLSRDPSPSISQFLAEFINTITFGNKDKRGFLSPTADQIDYLAKQLGGGVYREASGILTYVSNEIQDKETPDYKVPIVGKIVGDLNSPPAISQRFYSNVIKMAEHEASIKGRIKRRESVTEYMRENPEASMWRRANTLENEISKLNRRRRELVEKQEPVERIKQIDDQKTRMMKQFNDQVRKYN